MTSVRIFFIGGVTSYRSLFNWLSLWIFVPTFLVAPLFQILLFTYIGRTAKLESDKFYVIGNALQYAALPCVFAMTPRFWSAIAASFISPTSAAAARAAAKSRCASSSIPRCVCPTASTLFA